MVSRKYFFLISYLFRPAEMVSSYLYIYQNYITQLAVEYTDCTTAER